MQDNFKDKAAIWDNDPKNMILAQEFVKQICNSIFLYKSDHIVEIGCGTGLAGILMSSMVRKMTLVDKSPAMIEVLNKKLSDTKHQNIEVITGELKDVKDLDINGIIGFMTLHHIENIESIVAESKARLKEGGFLIIGDLIKEDGSFHKGIDVPHKGFNIDELSTILMNEGFIILRNKIYDSISKNNKEYPIFIIIAQK